MWEHHVPRHLSSKLALCGLYLVQLILNLVRWKEEEEQGSMTLSPSLRSSCWRAVCPSHHHLLR